MKALIVIIASLISAQVLAAPVAEIKPIELGRPVEVQPMKPIEAIGSKAKPISTRPAISTDLSTSNPSGPECKGDMADQLTTGTNHNVNEVREALRFWQSRVSLGKCQGSDKKAQGLAGYDAEAREHFLRALIDTMNVLKRQGDYSAAQAKAAFDKELGEEGVAATVATLEQCEILSKTYFN